MIGMSTTMSRGFGCPQRYIQGPGELENLPELLSPLGKKPFLLIDEGVYGFLASRLEKIFTASKI